MKISRSSAILRTEYFDTLHRDSTTGLTVAYTDHFPDDRIDAAVIDHTDAQRSYFGCTYHYIVRTTGAVEIGRDPRTLTPRGNSNLAATNILIGVVGGRNESGKRVTTITPRQREAIEALMQSISDALQVPLEVTDYVHDKALRDEQIAQEKALDNVGDRLDELERLSR
jgi:hypothetical protein